MEFNKIIKEILLPVLVNQGFHIKDEHKGKILFSSTAFTIHCSYDYLFTHDFSFIICCQPGNSKQKCLEDFELVKLLDFETNPFQKLSESEQILRYATYWHNFLVKEADLLFNIQFFLSL